MAPKTDTPPDLTDPGTCWREAGEWAGHPRHACRLCAWDTIEGEAEILAHLEIVHAVGRPEPRTSPLLGPDGEHLVVTDDGPTHIALIEQARHLGVPSPDNLGLDELRDAIAEADEARADLLAAFAEAGADDLGDAIADAAAPDLATATSDELHAIAEAAGIDHADLDDDDLTDALLDLDLKD